MSEQQFYSFKKIIVVAILVSLVVGGITGGVAGVILGSLAKTAPEWLSGFGLELKNNGDDSIKEKNKIVTVEEESATIDAVKKVSPSVVSIVITKDLSKIYNLTGPNIFPFDDFFEFGFPSNNNGTDSGDGNSDVEKTEVGGGTGFIISADGLILTNKHVVSDNEASYTVITSGGERYEAKVLSEDFLNDIAILKIDAKNLPVVEFGNSDDLEIGQTVIAIGNTLAEYRNTVTKGVISGIDRKVTAGDGLGQSEVIEGAIQTDAAINPGNSGGPLINLSGQVIGVNTAINRSGQLVGFAIPINSVKPAIESVKTYGKIIRPFLGVRYVLLNEQIAKANNLSVDYGALIIRGRNTTDLAIIPGSPADKAGLVENDIILEINGQKIDAETNLARQIVKYQPGEEVEMKIYNKGEEKIVKVKLEEYKENQ
ncbi:MAG: trypsin-like peptidase domain-containing protein [Patescibacteria group bacterium]|nr:trypsin-like peptidase domain-containing protein [Patescibacteria group bacterium]MDD5490253.1 trypsin-like peptidase domain-containing protein [Patescibacteria group bacterium]